MAHKSDPIEKVRKRVEQDTREHKARVQEEQERKKNLWRVWTLFQAIVCSWDGGIKKKFPRIPEKEIRATYFQEVSGHIIDLRKQLAVVGWKKHLNKFPFEKRINPAETRAEIVVFDLLTRKLNRPQIARVLRNEAEKPEDGLLRDHFNSAFTRLLDFLPQSDKEKEFWTRCSKYHLGETGDTYSPVISKAELAQNKVIAGYLKCFDEAVSDCRRRNVTPGFFDRDVRWARRRISGLMYSEIAKNEGLPISAADPIRNAINRLLVRLKLDKAKIGLQPKV